MAVASIPMDKQAATFRTCPVTTFKVDLAAEKLIIANAVAAVVFLAIGGIFSLLIGLTRVPAIHLLPANWFYRSVTGHGLDMLVVWIVFFEIAGLIFGTAIMLNARVVAPKFGWFNFGLMLVGALIVNVMVLIGDESAVMFTAYVPLKAPPLFYLGIILFAVGALLAVIMSFVNVVVAKREGKLNGSLPLVVFGLITAAILAIYTLLNGALAYVPAFLYSLEVIPSPDAALYRNLMWGFGHPAQQVNLAAMVAVWYALAWITTGANPINEKFSRVAFILYLFFINLGSAHHLLVDPGLSFGFKATNTSYGMYLAVLGSLIHAFSIPAAVEVALRKQGHRQGLLGWLRNAPWKEPGFGGMVVSMVMFGWIGGVTGVVIGTEQLNMIVHNTLRVPGHFHATVVGGTTTAFMALTYYLIPLVFRRELKFKNVASWQPYVFGLGMLLVAIGFIATGLQGVSRRHWDISFAQAAFPSAIPGTVDLTLAIAGIGVVIAFIGGGMYLWVVLASVFTGKKTEANALMLITPMWSQPKIADEEAEHLQPRGTFALVIVYLFFFAAYYLSNWWLLGGRVWGIR